MPVKSPIVCLLLSCFLFAGTGAYSNDAYAAWYVDEYGQLVYQSEKDDVLGIVYAKDGDENGDSSGSSSSGSGSGSSSEDSSSGSDSSGSDSSGSSSSGSSSSISGSSSGSSSQTDTFSFSPTTTTSTIKPSQEPTESPEKEDEQEQVTKNEPIEPPEPSHADENEETTSALRIKTEDGKTEFIFSEGEKIKVRTKDGETRTDIYSGGVKVRLEQKDGRLIIKAENEEGEERELGEQEIFKIEERIDKNEIKVSTASGNVFIISRGTTSATTHFPLSIDLATNTLIVETSTGPKTVAVLPDAAIQNLLAANIIDQLGPQNLAEQATVPGTLSQVSQVVELGETNNIAAYEIHGVSNQRLLGIFPVSISKQISVSAETGEIVSQNLSLLNRFLDLVSF